MVNIRKRTNTQSASCLQAGLYRVWSAEVLNFTFSRHHWTLHAYAYARLFSNTCIVFVSRHFMHYTSLPLSLSIHAKQLLETDPLFLHLFKKDIGPAKSICIACWGWITGKGKRLVWLGYGCDGVSKEHALSCGRFKLLQLSNALFFVLHSCWHIAISMLPGTNTFGNSNYFAPIGVHVCTSHHQVFLVAISCVIAWTRLLQRVNLSLLHKVGVLHRLTDSKTHRRKQRHLRSKHQGQHWSLTAKQANEAVLVEAAGLRYLEWFYFSIKWSSCYVLPGLHGHHWTPACLDEQDIFLLHFVGRFHSGAQQMWHSPVELHFERWTWPAENGEGDKTVWLCEQHPSQFFFFLCLGAEDMQLSILGPVCNPYTFFTRLSHVSSSYPPGACSSQGPDLEEHWWAANSVAISSWQSSSNCCRISTPERNCKKDVLWKSILVRLSILVVGDRDAIFCNEIMTRCMSFIWGQGWGGPCEKVMVRSVEKFLRLQYLLLGGSSM